MSDKKITQLNNITGANLVDADEFVVVDISADETKAITLGELKEAFDSGSGFVRITGDTMTGDLSFGDNDKAIFGAGSDLQIYHNGSNSYLDEVGTGNLFVRANNLRLSNADNSQYYLIADNSGFVKLNYAGATKISTTSTGVDVTGTITSDGLAVDGGATSPTISITGARSGTLATISNTSAATSNGLLVSTTSVSANSNPLWVRSNSLDRLKVAGNGDISFYATDGITQAFYWDAADERLGLGTTTPARPLSVSRDATSSIVASFESANTQGAISFQGSATTSDTAVRIGAEGNQLFVVAGGSEALRISGNGDVGIGTSSPSTELHIQNTSGDADVQIESTSSGGDARLNLYADSAGVSQIRFGDEASANVGMLTYDHADNSMAFRTNSAEAMTIDSDGEILVLNDLRISANSGSLNSSDGTGYLIFGERVAASQSNAPFITQASSDGAAQDLALGAHSGDAAIRFFTGASSSSVPFTGNNTERMVIDSNGDVGIGADSPDFRLEVRDSIATVTNASHSVAMFGNENTGADANTFIALKTRQGDSALRERAVLGAGLEGTSGGYFSIWTRPSGSALTEKVRVTGEGNMRIGNTTQEITGLTQTNLVVSSGSGGEIVAYRNDNGVVAGDFVGAFLFGNDDNAATEDHFAGMWAKASSTNGSMDIHWAAGRNNYETDTPQMTLDSSGNVGIGTSSPDKKLHVEGGMLLDAYNVGEDEGLFFREGFLNIDQPSITVWDKDNGGVSPDGLSINANDGIRFRENGGEVARFDDGDFLVGKTSASSSAVGFETKQTGFTAATRDGNTVLVLNRLTSDGTIVDLRKDGATVGSIGVASSNPYMASTGCGFRITGASVRPTTTSGVNSDNTVDLGFSSARWKDLYLSGGVYLGGTGAANKLDDYEEGTWDITITDLTNNATLNASYDTGVYTKVGRLVTLTGRFIMSSKGSLSGRIYIGGIPFSGIGGNSYNSGGFTAGKADGLAITAGTSIGGEITSNSDRISLVLWGSADGSSYMDTTNLDATADMSFSITYMTAA